MMLGVGLVQIGHQMTEINDRNRLFLAKPAISERNAIPVVFMVFGS
jgi:hypothetical protein